jgi:hypothetical protein
MRKWLARIVVRRESTHLGYHVKEETAARAYDTAAMQHGMLKFVNFPSEWENGRGGGGASEGVHPAAVDPTVAVDSPSAGIQFNTL